MPRVAQARTPTKDDHLIRRGQVDPRATRQRRDEEAVDLWLLVELVDVLLAWMGCQ